MRAAGAHCSEFKFYSQMEEYDRVTAALKQPRAMVEDHLELYGHVRCAIR